MIPYGHVTDSPGTGIFREDTKLPPVVVCIFSPRIFRLRIFFRAGVLHRGLAFNLYVHSLDNRRTRIGDHRL